MFRGIVTVLSAAALVGGMVAPAQAAAPVERFRYSETASFTECGGAYSVAAAFSGRVLVRDTNPALGGQFFRFSDNYEFTDVITNRRTGKYVTLRGNGNFKELRVRNLGGGVFRFRTHDTGLFTIRDASGALLLRETGLVEVEYVFDSLNDGKPGGRFLSESLVRVSGQHPTFAEGFDFCGLLAKAIG